MPNNNRTNDILSGLAFAIGLGNKLRDPNKDQRNKLLELLQMRPDLIQQYKDQGNPDIARTLAGMKPRFGPSGGYDKLTGLINNAPESPEVTRSKYLRGVLSDTSNSTPIPSSSNSLLGPVVQGINNDRANKDQDREDYLKTGKIRTAQEKEADKLALDTKRTSSEEGTARLKIAQLEEQDKIEERARIDAARKLSLPVVSRLSKLGETNLYKSILEGKNVSGDEANAMWTTPELVDRLKNDRMVYQDQQEAAASGENRRLMRENSAVTNLIEDARAAGQYISAEQAQQAIRNPQAALNDATVGPILTGLRDFNKKKVLPAAKANFIRETNALRTDFAKGRVPKEEDVQAFNNASMAAYSGTGFMPLVFALGDVTDAKTGEKKTKLIGRNPQQLVIVGGDPDLIKDYKGVFQVQEPKKEEESNPIVDQAIKQFATEADFLADMKKSNVSEANQAKLIAGYRKKKGVR